LPQDLVFVVREVPDERFTREGDDLLVRVSIRLPDALSEGKLDIPHLDGRVLRVPVKEVRIFPCYGFCRFEFCSSDIQNCPMTKQRLLMLLHVSRLSRPAM
jgi:hypothetical protein